MRKIPNFTHKSIGYIAHKSIGYIAHKSVAYISKPIILLLFYIFLRDLTKDIPYLNLILQSDWNRLIVLWVFFLLLYSSAMTINRIVIAIIIIMLLGLLSLPVGAVVYVSLFFIIIYHIKQANYLKTQQ